MRPYGGPYGEPVKQKTWRSLTGVQTMEQEIHGVEVGKLPLEELLTSSRLVRICISLHWPTKLSEDLLVCKH